MSSGLSQELQKVKDKISAAFAKQDTATIASLYAEDCKVMPPGSDVMMGREAAVTIYGNAMRKGSTQFVLESSEVGPVGPAATVDMAYDRGYFFNKYPDKTTRGKYVLLWKKVNGCYQVYTDIFNSCEESCS